MSMCLFAVQTERSISLEIISNLINCIGLCVHTHITHLMDLGAITIIAILKESEGLLAFKST